MNPREPFSFTSTYLDTYRTGWNRRLVRVGKLVLIFGRRHTCRIPLRVSYGATQLL